MRRGDGVLLLDVEADHIPSPAASPAAGCDSLGRRIHLLLIPTFQTTQPSAHPLSVTLRRL